jgi:two-component system, OmpR family, phosphate regulon sensor histidine kinase PhoR
MRFRPPANVFLRRAQLILMLATLVPTVLLTGLGIVLLVVGSSSGLVIVGGVLAIAFTTSAITGYILGSIFISRGASETRVQTDFLSSVSHELRTPLTSMRMFIETLKDGRVTDPDEQKKCLQIVHEELARLDSLVGRLIELSRLEAGRHVYERKSVAVRDVLDDAVAAFRAATLREKVDLQVERPDDLWIIGDRMALAQAIVNLLTNAWKYGPTGTVEIKLAARDVGKAIEISVTDNGPGIPPPERKRIFGNFERGRAALAGRKPGSGLGLAIVRAIVRAHRGRIELKTDARGSRFSLVLPAAAHP